MRPDIREEWAQALESGQYEQTRHHLHSRKPFNPLHPFRSRDSYCAIGVLLLLAEKHGAIGPKWKELGLGLSTLNTVRSWSGLSREEQEKVVQFNDNYLRDFPGIARWIRATIGDDEP